MAKKKTSKKKNTLKEPTRKAASKKTGRKSASKKASKKTAKKSASKKVAKKKTTKKSSKKKTVKKTAKKSVKKTAKKKTSAKKGVKKTAKKTSKKKNAKKKTTRKKTAGKTAKKSAAKKPVSKKTASKKTLKKTVAKVSSSDVDSISIRDEQFREESVRSEVEMRKFQLQAEQFGHSEGVSNANEQAASLPARELESSFDETLLVLLVRDPEWVFIYWEIDDATRERFLIPRSGHDGRLMIRYYDVTDCNDAHLQNASRMIDCEVNDFTSSWYQHLPEPNRMWCAEIGVISAEGEFLPICRSNTVHTPRASVAPVSSREKWLRVGEKYSDWRFIETPGGVSPEKASRMGLESRQKSPDTLHFVLTAEGKVESVLPGEDPEGSTPLTREQAELIMHSRIGSSEEIWRFNLQSLLGKLGGASGHVMPSSLNLPSSAEMPSSDSMIDPDED